MEKVDEESTLMQVSTKLKAISGFFLFRNDEPFMPVEKEGVANLLQDQAEEIDSVLKKWEEEAALRDLSSKQRAKKGSRS